MLTRRDLLMRGAGAAALAALPSALSRARGPRRVLLLDTATRESLRGYRAAGIETTPAAIALASLVAGATLIVEPGSLFGTDAEFARERAMLRDVFGVRVRERARLWGTSPGVPYIRYAWPERALVRDFSVAATVDPDCGDVIARVGERAVAVRRRLGRGTLIFLGSPLGPALYAGDPDARRWVARIEGRQHC